MLLEEALQRANPQDPGRKRLPPAVKGPFPLTDDFLDWAKRQGRE